MNDENVMAMVSAAKPVTDEELAEVERLDAAPLHEAPVPEQRLQELGLTLLPRVAAEVRRLTQAEQDAYRRGRREAIEEAARYIRRGRDAAKALDEPAGGMVAAALGAAADGIERHEKLIAKGHAHGK